MFEKFKISANEKESILGLIPLLLFFIVQITHDNFSPKFGEDVESFVHTNWSIFYFSGIWFSYIIYIALKFKKLTKLYKLLYSSFGLSLFVAIVIEVNKLGTDFYEYIRSVNKPEQGCFLVGIILVGLFTTLIFKRMIK